MHAAASAHVAILRVQQSLAKNRRNLKGMMLFSISRGGSSEGEGDGVNDAR